MGTDIKTNPNTGTVKGTDIGTETGTVLQTATDNGTDTHTLSAKNLTASWNKKNVLQNINLDLNTKEFVCLSGPNGSGKSTLLTLMAGIRKNGLKGTDILLDSVPLKALSRLKITSHIAYLTQAEFPAWNYTARDVVLTGRFGRAKSGLYTPIDYAAAEEAIKKVQIENLADKNILSLSGGEYQKVRIARALAQNTAFLLLDEPVANLDFAYQNDLLALLKELAYSENKGILVCIHDLNTAARFADRLALLQKNGSLVSGTPAQVMSPQILEQIYGHNHKFSTFIHPGYKCLQAYEI